MGIRALVVIGIFAAVAVWWGGQNTYIAIRDRDQLEISCADYVKQRPDARWLKLTNCEYDFDHLAYEESSSGDKYNAIYLPLRPVGETGGPTIIVVKRDDKDMLGVVYDLEHDRKPVKPVFDRVTEQMLEPTQGLVQFGLDLDDKDKKELAKLNLGLANDFVIIDYGDRPKLAKGILVLLLGVGGFGALAYLFIRGRRKPKAPPPQPPRPFNPTNPVSNFERSF